MSCCCVRVSIHWKIMKRNAWIACIIPIHITDIDWYNMYTYVLHVIAYWCCECKIRMQQQNWRCFKRTHTQTHTGCNLLDEVYQPVTTYWKKKVYACATKLSFLNYFEWRQRERMMVYKTNWGSRSKYTRHRKELARCTFQFLIDRSQAQKIWTKNGLHKNQRLRKKHRLLFGAYFLPPSFCVRAQTRSQ